MLSLNALTSVGFTVEVVAEPLTLEGKPSLALSTEVKALLFLFP